MIVIYPVLTTSLCVLTKWTRHMGFCITYTSLLMKTWRSKITKDNEKKRKKGIFRVNLTYRVKSAHKLKLTDKQLLQWMIPILLIMAIYLSTWWVLSCLSQSAGYKSFSSYKQQVFDYFIWPLPNYTYSCPEGLSVLSLSGPLVTHLGQWKYFLRTARNSLSVNTAGGITPLRWVSYFLFFCPSDLWSLFPLSSFYISSIQFLFFIEGELIFLLWGISICINVRKARTYFDEATQISWSIYNIALVNCIMAAIQ